MLDQNRIGVDVRPLHDRLLHRLEWFVGGQHQAVGIVDQRVAGDAGFRLVCPGKSSVDDQQFASALDRGLPRLRLHRNMAVDDVTLLPAESELRQDGVYHILPLQQTIVRILRLLMSNGILHKIALKGRHLGLAENRGMLVFPDKPQNVLPLLFLDGIHSIVPLSGVNLNLIVERFAGELLPVDLHLLKTSVLVQRHTAVVKQISVVNLVEAPLGVEETDMTLQFLTVHKSAPQPLHHIHLLFRQSIGILGIQRRETGGAQRIFLSVHHDGSLLEIHLV